MNAVDIASALLFAGVGGFLGALATAVLAGNRLALSWGAFALELRSYLASRPSDAALVRVRAAFETLESDFNATLSALKRIRLGR